MRQSILGLQITATNIVNTLFFIAPDGKIALKYVYLMCLEKEKTLLTNFRVTLW